MDYAAEALARGLKGIIFTCHCPLPDGISHAVRMAPEDYDRYVEWVGEARDQFAGRLDVRGMLRALIDVKYQGVVAFEYEKVAGNPVTGLAESVGYVRGLLAGMS